MIPVAHFAKVNKSVGVDREWRRPDRKFRSQGLEAGRWDEHSDAAEHLHVFAEAKLDNTAEKGSIGLSDFVGKKMLDDEIESQNRRFRHGFNSFIQSGGNGLPLSADNANRVLAWGGSKEEMNKADSVATIVPFKFTHNASREFIRARKLKQMDRERYIIKLYYSGAQHMLTDRQVEEYYRYLVFPLIQTCAKYALQFNWETLTDVYFAPPRTMSQILDANADKLLYKGCSHADNQHVPWCLWPPANSYLLSTGDLCEFSYDEFVKERKRKKEFARENATNTTLATKESTQAVQDAYDAELANDVDTVLEGRRLRSARPVAVAEPAAPVEKAKTKPRAKKPKKAPKTNSRPIGTTTTDPPKGILATVTDYLFGDGDGYPGESGDQDEPSNPTDGDKPKEGGKPRKPKEGDKPIKPGEGGKPEVVLPEPLRPDEYDDDPDSVTYVPPPPPVVVDPPEVVVTNPDGQDSVALPGQENDAGVPVKEEPDAEKAERLEDLDFRRNEAAVAKSKFDAFISRFGRRPKTKKHRAILNGFRVNATKTANAYAKAKEAYDKEYGLA